MLNLIWNTIWSNPFLSIPLLLCIPMAPIAWICINDTSTHENRNDNSSIWPIVGVGAGLYTIHKLNQVQKELRDLKETIKYRN